MSLVTAPTIGCVVYGLSLGRSVMRDSCSSTLNKCAKKKKKKKQLSEAMGGRSHD